ncbi:heterokaryon incompatibility protein-domain-containing protein [Aspergillus transmontanensis]|uniref:Heterokaryon incompatibility protein-domain-containing protein n=1 Tax=Aspergillus transmontanensis TaxID=1034304 RepID=A0A5N6W9Y1_9EURO|nr:heterokaryon incompatibility protein-domain-containing protein [Aspergillus transmontanensis]
MWLLNARTVALEEFFESEAPPYAILSHTWGEEEVSFQQIQQPQEVCARRKGYKKILNTCHQALKDELEYVWIDTCCIDKSSSAELSEAINSMFRWYGKATVCYTFLVDVPSGSDPYDHHGPFAKSRWFTRGWTLQELLAPEYMFFYASDWSEIASKAELGEALHVITGVEPDSQHDLVDWDTLQGPCSSILHQASIAERMSWASSRKTTRTEDMAYCLLGIFGINMPLIYGEGERAFRRLQEEIIKTSNDQSILAWGVLEPWRSSQCNQSHRVSQRDGEEERVGILARSPAAFRGCGTIIPYMIAEQGDNFPLSVTNKGLHICLPIPKSKPSQRNSYIALLQCRLRQNPCIILAISITRVHGNIYTRVEDRVQCVDYRTWSPRSMKGIYLSLEDYIEEVLYEDRFFFRQSSICIRRIPDTFSVQELSPQARNLIMDIFPPDHTTISPGLSPCTGNIALLLISEEMVSKVVLYFSLTELPGVGSSPYKMVQEAFLISVPYESTNLEICDYLSTSKNTSNYVWLGKDILYSKVMLQSVTRISLFTIDIHLTSHIPHVLWFQIQRLIPNHVRSFLFAISSVWQVLHFLFKKMPILVIFTWLLQQVVCELIRLPELSLEPPHRHSLFLTIYKSPWLRLAVKQLFGMFVTIALTAEISVDDAEYFLGHRLYFLAFLYCLPFTLIIAILTISQS